MRVEHNIDIRKNFRPTVIEFSNHGHVLAFYYWSDKEWAEEEAEDYSRVAIFKIKWK